MVDSRSRQRTTARRQRLGRRFLTVGLVTIIVVASTFRRSSWIEKRWYESSTDDISKTDKTEINGNGTTVGNTPQQQLSESSSSSFLLPKATNSSSSMFKPVTKIDRDNICNFSNNLHDQHQNLRVQKVESFPHYQDPSKFYIKTRSTSINKKDDKNQNDGRTKDSNQIMDLCKLNTDTTHFPHVMQQLYGCYTYWQRDSRRGEQADQQQRQQQKPVLVLHSSSSPSSSGTDLTSKLRKNQFLDGIIQTLVNQMNVRIMSERELIEKIRTTTTTSTNSSPALLIQDFGHDVLSGGYILFNISKLNGMVHQEFGALFDTVNNKENVAVQQRHRQCIPTIGILNRRPSSGRSILNTNDILHRLQEEFSSSSSSTIANVLNEPEYFERDRSFQQQVMFFNNVDILLSPHGAQLTGIPFLGRRSVNNGDNGHALHEEAVNCHGRHKPQLLEIFPPNYLIPSFFGSLAVNSDIGYSHWYYDMTATKDQPGSVTTSKNQTRSSTIFERSDARAQNLCIDPNETISAVTGMVKEWKQLCDCNS
mmetsp:Transcript_14609/g.35558  ORF Transcript_14609/g.35558 Transcript_14609/m.35558 type:complete len:536 (-) Transcript_14609:1974-3581(-)